VGGLRAFDEVCYKYAQIQGAEVRDTVFLCVLNVLFCSASEKGVRKWYPSNRLYFVDNRVDVLGKGLVQGVYRFAPCRLRICNNRGHIATAMYRQGN